MDRDFGMRFIRDYTGPKLTILATGGGMGLGALAGFPGASRVLHSFYCPYATTETIRFLRENHPAEAVEAFAASAVSRNAALDLFHAMEWHHRDQDCNILVVSAACTSTNYRRGENRAYITFRNQTGVLEEWHLKLPKLTKEEHEARTPWTLCDQRDREDSIITLTAFHLATNFESSALEGMIANGSLTRFSS